MRRQLWESFSNGAVQYFEPCVDADNEVYLLKSVNNGPLTYISVGDNDDKLTSNGSVSSPITQYLPNESSNQNWDFASSN